MKDLKLNGWIFRKRYRRIYEVDYVLTKVIKLDDDVIELENGVRLINNPIVSTLEPYEGRVVYKELKDSKGEEWAIPTEDDLEDIKKSVYLNNKLKGWYYPLKYN